MPGSGIRLRPVGESRQRTREALFDGVAIVGAAVEVHPRDRAAPLEQKQDRALLAMNGETPVSRPGHEPRSDDRANPDTADSDRGFDAPGQ